MISFSFNDICKQFCTYIPCLLHKSFANLKMLLQDAHVLRSKPNTNDNKQKKKKEKEIHKQIWSHSNPYKTVPCSNFSLPLTELSGWQRAVGTVHEGSVAYRTIVLGALRYGATLWENMLAIFITFSTR